MALFHYRAIDAEGRLVSGSLDAADQAAVVDHLNANGLLPIEAATGASPPPSRSLPIAQRRARHRISSTELVLFTRKLASVVQAGLDLDKGLEVAGSASRVAELKRMVARLLDDIRAGK